MTLDREAGAIAEPLTPMEQSALVHAETAIERGLSSFIEVGEALAKVREEGLYRETFSTFEAYCRERWNITDRRARQMIDAATVTASLPTGTVVPVTESQARELSGLTPTEAADVLGAAHAATNGNLTAGAIRAARNPQTPAPEQGGEASTGAGQSSRDEEPPTEDSTPTDVEEADPPAPRPAEPTVDLEAFVAADENVQLTAWRRSFMGHIKRAGELMLFEPDVVAEKAGADLSAELDRLAHDITDYAQRVRAERPFRLTAIRGGAQ